MIQEQEFLADAGEDDSSRTHSSTDSNNNNKLHGIWTI